MGPRSFDRGNLRDSEDIPWVKLASMGPRSFHRGNGVPVQAAERPLEAVILRSPPFLLADDEGSRTAFKIFRARFFASLRMTSWKRFSAACVTFQFSKSQCPYGEWLGHRWGCELASCTPSRRLLRAPRKDRRPLPRGQEHGTYACHGIIRPKPLKRPRPTTSGPCTGCLNKISAWQRGVVLKYPRTRYARAAST